MGTSLQRFGSKADLFVAIHMVAIVIGMARVARGDGAAGRTNANIRWSGWG